MTQLEKLQLRAVNGLTLAEDCRTLTDVKGLDHLKSLVILPSLLWLLLPLLNPSLIVVWRITALARWRNSRASDLQLSGHQVDLRFGQCIFRSDYYFL